MLSSSLLISALFCWIVAAIARAIAPFSPSPNAPVVCTPRALRAVASNTCRLSITKSFRPGRGRRFAGCSHRSLSVRTSVRSNAIQSGGDQACCLFQRRRRRIRRKASSAPISYQRCVGANTNLSSGARMNSAKRNSTVISRKR